MYRHRSDKVLRSLYQMLIMLTESIHPEREIKQPNRKNNSGVDVSLYHWTSQVKKKKDIYIYTHMCECVCVCVCVCIYMTYAAFKSSVCVFGKLLRLSHHGAKN